jgi:signal transduction histidine kinase
MGIHQASPSAKLAPAVEAAQPVAISALAAGLAHELNNCLTPITLLTQHMLERPDLDNTTREQLASVLEMARRGRQLVQRALACSRPSSTEARQVFAPGGPLEEARQRLLALAPPTVAVEAQVGPDCPNLLGDPAWLIQVIVNLGINAVQAMEHVGGTLTLTIAPMSVDESFPTLPPGSYVSLVINDTGIGMNAALRERIFEPYFTTRDAQHGTGLGLPIVQQLVRNMSGQMQITSAEGVGTRVQVILPAALAMADKAPNAGGVGDRGA